MRFIVGSMMVVFGLVGVALVVSASREFLRRLLIHDRFQHAEGVVVDVQSKLLEVYAENNQPTIMNFPVITFSQHTGEEVTFTSEVGDAGTVSRYEKGQRLLVRYDPSGEFSPMLDSWSGAWLPNLMYLGAGVVFLGGAYLIYWSFWDRIAGQ